MMSFFSIILILGDYMKKGFETLLIASMGTFLFIFGIFTMMEDTSRKYEISIAEYKNLFDNNGNLKEDITTENIENVEKKINEIKNPTEEQKQILTSLQKLKNYVNVKNNQ